MKNEKEPSSLQQVALPAQGQCEKCGGTRHMPWSKNPCSYCHGTGRALLQGGAPDSRSETLSPREWPTLEAAHEYYCELYVKQLEDPNGFVDAMATLKKIQMLEIGMRTLRSGRPRGESGGDQRPMATE